jgi:hypothetical protein
MLGDALGYVRRILFEMGDHLMVFGIFVYESGQWCTQSILLLAAVTSPSQDVDHTHRAMIRSRHLGVYLVT